MIGSRGHGLRHSYRVKWLGWPIEQASWRPAAECHELCPERVRQYEETQRQRRRAVHVLRIAEEEQRERRHRWKLAQLELKSERSLQAEARSQQQRASVSSIDVILSASPASSPATLPAAPRACGSERQQRLRGWRSQRRHAEASSQRRTSLGQRRGGSKSINMFAFDEEQGRDNSCERRRRWRAATRRAEAAEAEQERRRGGGGRGNGGGCWARRFPSSLFSPRGGEPFATSSCCRRPGGGAFVLAQLGERGEQRRAAGGEAGRRGAGARGRSRFLCWRSCGWWSATRKQHRGGAHTHTCARERRACRRRSDARWAWRRQGDERSGGGLARPWNVHARTLLVDACCRSGGGGPSGGRALLACERVGSARTRGQARRAMARGGTLTTARTSGAWVWRRRIRRRRVRRWCPACTPHVNGSAAA